MKNKCKILGAKSIMALVLCFCMLFTLAPISVSAYETIEDLNLIAGRPISFKNHNVKNYTFYNNGVTYIPLRMTSQMCGFAVMWDAQTNGISITKAGKFIKCNPVDDNYVVGSQNIKLGGLPVLVEGTTFVPESFISNVLGLQFTSSWNGISIYDGEELSCTITDISLEHDDDDDGEKWMRVQTDDYGIKRVDVTGTQFYKCKFNDLNIGDMLEISLKCAYSDSEWLAATVTRISEADEDGNISFDGSILSVSKSTIKIEVDKDTTLTLKLTDDTKIKYKGSSRKLDYKDLEEEMEVYGYYEYTSKNKGNCLSLTIGKSNGSSSSKYDDDDNETGEEISFKGAKVKNFTDDYITIIWEDETIKLTIDDDTMLRDADNHNSRIDLDDFEYEGDMYCRGSYEYRSSTKGLAYMLYFTTDSSEYDKYYDEDGDYRGDDDDDDDRYDDDRYDDDRDDDYDYEEGEEIDFRDIEVLEVKGSYIVVDFDGIEMKWYYDEDETEVEQKGSSRECDFEDIEEGMEIEGYFEYRSLTKGILLYVELPDEDDYDYDDRYDDDRYDDDRYDDDRDGYEKGDKVSFDEAELLEVSSDYIVLDIDGKEVKLTIDEDTTVRYGSKTITDVTARKFKSYIGEYLSGTYKFVSSTKGTAIRVTFEDVEEDDDDYDDYEDYEDEDYDEDYVEGIITKVSGSYILVEDDDEDEYKLYVDSDTKVKYQGKSREYTIDDLEKGMEVEVDFYERSSSKLQATKVVVLD